MNRILDEIAKLTKIGKIDSKLNLIIKSDFKHILPNLSYVYLLFTDHRVRYGKINFLKQINDIKAVFSIDNIDLLEEIEKEKSVLVALDDEILNMLEGEQLYYDPIGMEVIWNSTIIGVISDFYYNGAHDVYEISLNKEPSRNIYIPDVDRFVIETNPDERFIKVVDIDQFINL